MKIISWFLTLATLCLSWYFFSWQLTLIISLLYVSLFFQYITLKLAVAEHKIDEGHPIEDVFKNIF